jgi:hypothetical protein
MAVIEFPKKSQDKISKGFIARLDAQNKVVINAIGDVEQASAVVMMQMQKYLSILQSFIKAAGSEELVKFLRDKGREHNLDITIDDDIAFQLQLEFDEDE